MTSFVHASTFARASASLAARGPYAAAARRNIRCRRDDDHLAAVALQQPDGGRIDVAIERLLRATGEQGDAHAFALRSAGKTRGRQDFAGGDYERSRESTRLRSRRGISAANGRAILASYSAAAKRRGYGNNSASIHRKARSASGRR